VDLQDRLPAEELSLFFVAGSQYSQTDPHISLQFVEIDFARS